MPGVQVSVVNVLGVRWREPMRTIADKAHPAHPALEGARAHPALTLCEPARHTSDRQRARTAGAGPRQRGSKARTPLERLGNEYGLARWDRSATVVAERRDLWAGLAVRWPATRSLPPGRELFGLRLCGHS